MKDWVVASWSALPMTVASAFAVLAVVIALTRLNGLRSFSKMSGFDFAMTIAMGSVLGATVVNPEPSIVAGALALASLFAVQWVVSHARNLQWFRTLVDNQPVLLMDGNQRLEANMRRARVTHDDLTSKLREANVLNNGQVYAVVLEATGDVSVLHGTGADDESFDREAMLAGVRRS